MYDCGELEILDQAECRHLLRETRIGRFVFWDQLHFAVHPVRYVYDGGSRILLRSENGAKVNAASRQNMASLEIDHIDPVSGHGWSVIASGTASHVTDSYEVEKALMVLPRPWASSDGTDVVCLHIDILEGRRFQGPTRPSRAAGLSCEPSTRPSGAATR